MILLLAPAAALAQPEPKVLVATGKEVTQTVSPGVLICEGGQPTGQAFPPCSPSTKKILLRNLIMVGTYSEVTGTAAGMFRGKSTIITQCNLDDKYYGFCWGTLEWAAPELEGKWEGSWWGVLDFVASAGSISADCYGYGGKLEGLRMRFDEVEPGAGLPTTFIARVLAK
jgi:hypothetical protein